MIRSLLFACAFAAAVGRADEPGRREYHFTQPPLEIYDALHELKLGEVPKMPAEERAFLEATWRWRTEKSAADTHRDDDAADAALLDAMLWASGIEEPATRAAHREKFAGVVAAAREATKDAKTDRERGELLMKSLHAGVMKGGYDLDQTSLATVFDSGKFNCVSSTAMYLLTGRRLGLALEPISIPGQPFVPGHAALDLMDGTARVQVEPTNPDGFDWETKSKQPGVIIIGFVPDRKKGRATDALGIAASIYTNRSVALSKADDPPRLASIRLNLSALACNPVDETATNNLLSDFVNWGPALAKEMKFAEAVRVLSFGRRIAPESPELKDNLVSAYAQQIQALLAAKADRAAVELVKTAADAIPEHRDFQNVAEWFKRESSRQRQEDGYDAGLAVVERGLALVSASDQKTLREWRSSLLRQLSQELLEKGDIAGSTKALARGYAIDAQDPAIHDGVGYHTIQALAILDKQQDEKLTEHFQELTKQFPLVKDVAEAGYSFAAEAVLKLADTGKFEDAIRATKRYLPLVADAKQQAELGALPYDRWGRQLAEQKLWQKACGKYAEALKMYPKQPRLVQNLAATVVEWSEPEIDAMTWDEAIRIYDIGLAILPEHSLLQQNRRFCEAKKKGE